MFTYYIFISIYLTDGGVWLTGNIVEYGRMTLPVLGVEIEV
jgi:hypothetical protein